MAKKESSVEPEPVPLRFLKEFQEYCRLLPGEKRSLHSSLLDEIRSLSNATHPLLEKPEITAAELQRLQQFTRCHVNFLETGEWLAAHEGTCGEVARMATDQINVYQPQISPLWQEFIQVTGPQWQEDFRAITRICENVAPPLQPAPSSSETAPAFSKSPSAKPAPVKPATAKPKSKKVKAGKAALKKPVPRASSPRKAPVNAGHPQKEADASEEAPAKVEDSAFFQNEDGSFEISPVRGDDYRDGDEYGFEDEVEQKESEDDLSDDYRADESDLHLSSADPTTLGPGENLPAPVRRHPKPVSPPYIRYHFQLSPQSAPDGEWRELFDRVVSRVFAEYSIDEKVGATYFKLQFPDERSLREYFAGEFADREDGNVEAERRFVTRVQESIITVFKWAVQNECRDLDRLLEDVRADLAGEDCPAWENLNEFVHHSNGHSKFLRTQIDYEGSWDDGASLQDGFSVQTARRAANSFME